VRKPTEHSGSTPARVVLVDNYAAMRGVIRMTLAVQRADAHSTHVARQFLSLR
jgi:hypothetical protein